MVDFFEFIGIVVVLYYLISIILWCVLDSDIHLWLKERWGKSPGKNKEDFDICKVIKIAIQMMRKKKQQNTLVSRHWFIFRNIERKSDLDYGCLKRYWKGIGT